MIRRAASIRWAIMLCLGLWSTTSFATVTNVKILIWNVRSYNDPTTAQFAALERVVAAVDPQILLLAEAQNPDGRAKFLADFPQYSYTFLGGPTSDLQRSQIVSVYPLVNTQELYTPDFSRPTIRADVQTDPTTPGMTQLRVYAVHYNASDTSVAAAQAAIDQATTANFFLLDIAGSGNDVPDGTINIYDLIAVKGNFDQALSSSCP